MKYGKNELRLVTLSLHGHFSLPQDHICCSEMHQTYKWTFW